MGGDKEKRWATREEDDSERIKLRKRKKKEKMSGEAAGWCVCI